MLEEQVIITRVNVWNEEAVIRHVWAVASGPPT